VKIENIREKRGAAEARGQLGSEGKPNRNHIAKSAASGLPKRKRGETPGKGR